MEKVSIIITIILCVLCCSICCSCLSIFGSSTAKTVTEALTIKPPIPTLLSDIYPVSIFAMEFETTTDTSKRGEGGTVSIKSPRGNMNILMRKENKYYEVSTAAISEITPGIGGLVPLVIAVKQGYVAKVMFMKSLTLNSDTTVDFTGGQNLTVYRESDIVNAINSKTPDSVKASTHVFGLIRMIVSKT